MLQHITKGQGGCVLYPLLPFLLFLDERIYIHEQLNLNMGLPGYNNCNNYTSTNSNNPSKKNYVLKKEDNFVNEITKSIVGFIVLSIGQQQGGPPAKFQEK